MHSPITAPNIQVNTQTLRDVSAAKTALVEVELRRVMRDPNADVNPALVSVLVDALAKGASSIAPKLLAEMKTPEAVGRLMDIIGRSGLKSDEQVRIRADVLKSSSVFDMRNPASASVAMAIMRQDSDVAAAVLGMYSDPKSAAEVLNKLCAADGDTAWGLGILGRLSTPDGIPDPQEYWNDFFSHSNLVPPTHLYPQTVSDGDYAAVYAAIRDPILQLRFEAFLQQEGIQTGPIVQIVQDASVRLSSTVPVKLSSVQDLSDLRVYISKIIAEPPRDVFLEKLQHAMDKPLAGQPALAVDMDKLVKALLSDAANPPKQVPDLLEQPLLDLQAATDDKTKNTALQAIKTAVLQHPDWGLGELKTSVGDLLNKPYAVKALTEMVANPQARHVLGRLLADEPALRDQVADLIYQQGVPPVTLTAVLKLPSMSDAIRNAPLAHSSLPGGPSASFLLAKVAADPGSVVDLDQDQAVLVTQQALATGNDTVLAQMVTRADIQTIVTGAFVQPPTGQPVLTQPEAYRLLGHFRDAKALATVCVDLAADPNQADDVVKTLAEHTFMSGRADRRQMLDVAIAALVQEPNATQPLFDLLNEPTYGTVTHSSTPSDTGVPLDVQTLATRYLAKDPTAFIQIPMRHLLPELLRPDRPVDVTVLNAHPELDNLAGALADRFHEPAVQDFLKRSNFQTVFQANLNNSMTPGFLALDQKLNPVAAAAAAAVPAAGVSGPDLTAVIGSLRSGTPDLFLLDQALTGAEKNIGYRTQLLQSLAREMRTHKSGDENNVANFLLSTPQGAEIMTRLTVTDGVRLAEDVAMGEVRQGLTTYVQDRLETLATTNSVGLAKFSSQIDVGYLQTDRFPRVAELLVKKFPATGLQYTNNLRNFLGTTPPPNAALRDAVIQEYVKTEAGLSAAITDTAGTADQYDVIAAGIHAGSFVSGGPAFDSVKALLAAPGTAGKDFLLNMHAVDPAATTKLIQIMTKDDSLRNSGRTLIGDLGMALVGDIAPGGADAGRHGALLRDIIFARELRPGSGRVGAALREAVSQVGFVDADECDLLPIAATPASPTSPGSPGAAGISGANLLSHLVATGLATKSDKTRGSDKQPVYDIDPSLTKAQLETALFPSGANADEKKQVAQLHTVLTQRTDQKTWVDFVAKNFQTTVDRSGRHVPASAGKSGNVVSNPMLHDLSAIVRSTQGSDGALGSYRHLASVLSDQQAMAKTATARFLVFSNDAAADFDKYILDEDDPAIRRDALAAMALDQKIGGYATAYADAIKTIAASTPPIDTQALQELYAAAPERFAAIRRNAVSPAGQAVLDAVIAPISALMVAVTDAGVKGPADAGRVVTMLTRAYPEVALTDLLPALRALESLNPKAKGLTAAVVAGITKPDAQGNMPVLDVQLRRALMGSTSIDNAIEKLEDVRDALVLSGASDAVSQTLADMTDALDKFTAATLLPPAAAKFLPALGHAASLLPPSVLLVGDMQTHADVHTMLHGSGAAWVDTVAWVFRDATRFAAFDTILQSKTNPVDVEKDFRAAVLRNTGQSIPDGVGITLSQVNTHLSAVGIDPKRQQMLQARHATLTTAFGSFSAGHMSFSDLMQALSADVPLPAFHDLMPLPTGVLRGPQQLLDDLGDMQRYVSQFQKAGSNPDWKGMYDVLEQLPQIKHELLQLMQSAPSVNNRDIMRAIGHVEAGLQTAYRNNVSSQLWDDMMQDLDKSLTKAGLSGDDKKGFRVAVYLNESVFHDPARRGQLADLWDKSGGAF